MKSLNSILTYLFIILTSQLWSQTVTSTVNTLEDGNHEIYYKDQSGKILETRLYLGDISSYPFDFNPTTYSTGPAEGTPPANPIWLPSENGGARPFDICYNDYHNKYYLYGDRRVIIVDGVNNEVIDAITVSNKGLSNLLAGYSLIAYQKRLAYNSIDHNTYCITNSGELIKIDGLTNTSTKLDDMDVEYCSDPYSYIYCHPLKTKFIISQKNKMMSFA